MPHSKLWCLKLKQNVVIFCIVTCNMLSPVDGKSKDMYLMYGDELARRTNKYFYIKLF